MKNIEAKKLGSQIAHGKGYEYLIELLEDKTSGDIERIIYDMMNLFAIEIAALALLQVERKVSFVSEGNSKKLIDVKTGKILFEY